MVELERTTDKLIGFIKRQRNEVNCKGEAINVFVTNLDSDIDTHFKEMDVDLEDGHYISQIDAETGDEI